MRLVPHPCYRSGVDQRGGADHPATRPIKARRGKGINDDREANRADARGSAEKEPGNYFWGGRSAHASVACWVCSVLWSRTSFYDSDHIAADFQGPESTPYSPECVEHEFCALCESV